MSTIRQRSILGAVLLVVASGLIASPAAAEDDDADADEGFDIATPGPQSNRQVATGRFPTAADPAVMTAEVAASAAPQPNIDDFVYDPLVTAGRAADVCYGSLRTGTLGTYRELTNRFGGSPGTLYSCRERYAVQERPECNGQVANPVTSPDFYSDCWSNHAQGRALDIMVGTSGGGYNQSRGNAIVNFLLAADAAGNPSANARRLGVQQILWNNRCWNSDGDRGITTAAGMRVCGYGHYDHIHIDLSIKGADGLTSWWGYPPERAPKINGLWYRDTESGVWQWQAFVNWNMAAVGNGSYPLGFTAMTGGDWNSDGIRNEIFAWNRTNGSYRVYDGTTGSQLFSGARSPGLDQFVAGDFDADGLVNDMLLLDTESGLTEMLTWTSGGPVLRGSGYWRPGWDTLVALDADSDGRIGETLLYDRDTGQFYVFTWSGATSIYLNSGQFQNIWDDVVAGDFDAQGNSDDVLFYDAASGFWVMLYWYGPAWASEATRGTWLTTWDHFVPGDWDTDGRVDDLFVRDDDSGWMTMLSFHRYSYHAAVTSQWLSSLDTWVAGTYG